MLFVDGLVELVQGEPSSLRAEHHLDPGDPILAGHFPTLPLWPGVLLIEGLAQTAQLLLALQSLTPEALAALCAPSTQPRSEARLSPGLLAAVDVKLTHPVVVSQHVRIDYHATYVDTRLGMARCDVAAHVAGRTVARGTLTLAELP